MDLSDIFPEYVNKDMLSKSLKFGVIIFVCSQVITKRVLYFKMTAKIIKVLAC